ncbi:MAG: hypothetical protein E7269_05325 [Lachnospiraceae bacterium]|nr:hypothetical protein [Lachnospiraceae bacterium]
MKNRINMLIFHSATFVPKRHKVALMLQKIAYAILLSHSSAKRFGMEETMKKRSNLFCNLVAALLTAVFITIHYYVTLPAINIHSQGFWSTLILYIAVFVILSILIRTLNGGTSADGPIKFNPKTGAVYWNSKGRHRGNRALSGLYITTKLGLAAIALIALILIVGNLISATIFRASAYASVISVQDADFETDIPETNEVTDIALMDTDSATIIGNRALGNLSEVVSQYELSSQYTQINFNDAPQKVSNLEYNGFFKWLNNKDAGIPGYVMVDPVNNVANYVEFETPLKYVTSAYFGEDLHRKLRFEYPTKIFDGCFFEVDEEGNPYYIVSCMNAKVGLFGAMDVTEVIIFNPCDGTSELYKIGEVPQWVDIVFTGDLASQKYNWHGIYSGGFFNSLIGQKGCKQTTDDYGYVMIDDDVWYYTGVTSVIADESNIGFILTNARTGEYKYYSIVGAEEHSAMAAAEGEVQETGYEASFPCLINVAGEASYIMVLKDNNGLVKQYALVNVENYNLVANADTQAEAIASYKKLLIDNKVISPDTEIMEDIPNEGEDEIPYTEVNITVGEVKFATIDGSTYIYLISEDKRLYKAAVEDDETVMFIEPGMNLTLSATESDESGIATFGKWVETE